MLSNSDRDEHEPSTVSMPATAHYVGHFTSPQCLWADRQKEALAINCCRSTDHKCIYYRVASHYPFTNVMVMRLSVVDYYDN